MSDATPDAASVQETLRAVVGLVANWSAASTQGSIAREVGVDIAEGDVRALYTIGVLGGSVRPADLADELQLSRPTASKLIARLASAGLIDRSRDSGDGRSARLELSHAGEQAYARLVGAGLRIVEEAMTGLTPDEVRIFAATSQRLMRGFGAG